MTLASFLLILASELERSLEDVLWIYTGPCLRRQVGSQGSIPPRV